MQFLSLFRFLQGPDTDYGTVAKIREAIKFQREVTVQLINYTKSGILFLLQSKTLNDPIKKKL